MTALTFPSNPQNGDTYTAPTGTIYTYDGVKWEVTSTSGGGGANTGDFTFSNNYVSTPTGVTMFLDSYYDNVEKNGELATRIAMGDNNGRIKLLGYSDPVESSFSDGGWTSGEWTYDVGGNPALVFTGAVDLVSYVQSDVLPGFNRYVRVNAYGSWMFWAGPYSEGAPGSGDISIPLDPADEPPSDPTTITMLEIKFQRENVIDINPGNDQILIKGRGCDINIQSDSITNIQTNGNEWSFDSNGNLTLPAGGDIVDSTGTSVLGGGDSTVKTNIELTNAAAPQDIWAGEWVEFVKTDYGSEVDEIDTGLSITRGDNQGIYNSAVEPGYDDTNGDPDGRGSPKNTVWNKTGGWGDLSNVATRTYDTFYNIHGGGIGNQVLTGQYVMKDLSTNYYYKVDFTVWGNANNGAPVSYTRTQIDPADGSFIGDPVEFVKPGYADPFLVYDAVSPDVHISRASNYSIFNTVSEQGYNSNSPGDGDGENSPQGTLWNLDGWRNLTDVKQRTYLPWVEMFDWAIGVKILNSECVMYDTANDKYYALKFTQWTGQNNGGGFAYRRRLINTDLIFVHTEGGDEVDDIAEGIGITRDTNNGIYNPYDEGSWDETVSPGGTEWSFAGNHDLSDIETRPYQPFFAAQNMYGIGNRIEGREAVMRLTGTNTYYTIKFLNWQAGGGGAFSYIRTPVDLTKINEGIRFADGTVQKTSASDPVKFRGPLGRTIEEYYGYKEVRITEATAYTLDTTARGNQTNVDLIEFNVPDQQTQQELINGTMRNVSVSFDGGTTWTALRRWYAYSGNYNGYYVALNTVGYAQTLTYTNQQNIKIRYYRGGEPQLWFDPAASPGGRGNFRGAVIQYHAYCDQAGTIIGTIMVANDDGDYNVTHSEVASGGSDVANVNLWYSDRSADDYNWNRSEGKLYAYRIDGDNDIIKIQWKATMFYGQEFWD